MAKINKKTGGKRGKNQVKNLPKGLEDGKNFRSRFWEGLKSVFPARNQLGNTHLSHTTQQGNNKENNHRNKIGDNNKFETIRSRRWEGGSIIFALIILSLTTLIITAHAQSSNEELQNELNNLTSYLSDNNYSWLINYSVSYPSVDVYRENSNDLLATFFNVSGGVNNSFKKYQIFLTGLGENESLSVFDLKSVAGLENSGVGSGGLGISYDYIVDPSPSGLFNWSIPYGYNLLNDSLGLGTFEGIGSDGQVVGVIVVPHDIYLKKLRIDEIRKELNKNGGENKI